MENSVRNSDAVGLTNLLVGCLDSNSASRIDKLNTIKDLLAKCNSHVATCIAEESKLQTMSDSKDG